MTEQAGHLNAPDLVEECVEAVMEAYYEDHDGMITRDVMRVLSVLRKRGLLTIQALELLADK